MTVPAHAAKRLIEIWQSGLYAREELLGRPDDILRRHRAEAYPQAFAALAAGDEERSRIVFADLNRFTEEKLAWRDQIRRDSMSDDPRYRAWRERQIRRCDFELSQDQNAVITHIPAAFELARGCSVNCWFCAFSAPPLEAVFRRTPDNVRLWRGVLTELRRVLGTAAASRASVYWATEPFDNPDYEDLCRDCLDILGSYPQTTTAVPLRQVERTRRVLRESLAGGCLINRFSVHTGEQLIGIHQAFSSEELLHTELLLENEESPMIVVHSGRTVDAERNSPELAERQRLRTIENLRARSPSGEEVPDDAVLITDHLAVEGKPGTYAISVPGTTACMSGFLVNMHAGEIRLISPCATDSDWPNGYIVFDQGRFDDETGFAREIERLIDENMPMRIRPEESVRLSRRVRFERHDNGFSLFSIFARADFRVDGLGDYLAHVGQLLHDGCRRAGEIAVECYYVFGQPEEVTLNLLQNLHDKGLLETGRHAGRKLLVDSRDDSRVHACGSSEIRA